MKKEISETHVTADGTITCNGCNSNLFGGLGLVLFLDKYSTSPFSLYLFACLSLYPLY
jgi:hypothetical protein